jgi:hypothetical protein
MDSLSRGMGWMAGVLCVALAWSLWMAVQGGITERREGVEGVGGPVRTGYEPSGDVMAHEVPVISRGRGVEKKEEEVVAGDIIREKEGGEALGPEVEVWVFDENGDPADGAMVCWGNSSVESAYVMTDDKGRAFAPTSLGGSGAVTWVKAGNDKKGWGEAEYPVKDGGVVQIVLSKEVKRNIAAQSVWAGEQVEVLVKDGRGEAVAGAVVHPRDQTLIGRGVLTTAQGRCHVTRKRLVGAFLEVLVLKEGMVGTTAPFAENGATVVILDAVATQPAATLPAAP